MLNKLTKLFFCSSIKGYQWFIRPLLKGQCRFYPSCSHYAIEAFERHGTKQGFVLTMKRLSRCHPWGSHGVDLVPEQSLSTQPQAISQKFTNEVKA